MAKHRGRKKGKQSMSKVRRLLETPQGPHEPELEQGVIGSILVASDAFYECAEEGLTYAHFWEEKHRKIYKVIQDWAEEKGSPDGLVFVQPARSIECEVTQYGAGAGTADRQQ